MSGVVITDAIRQRVRDAITPGLVSGLGVPEPGRMCDLASDLDRATHKTLALLADVTVEAYRKEGRA